MWSCAGAYPSAEPLEHRVGRSRGRELRQKCREPPGLLVVERGDAADPPVPVVDAEPGVRRALLRREVPRDAQAAAGHVDVCRLREDRDLLAGLPGRAPWAESMLRLDQSSTPSAHRHARSSW